MSAAVPTDETLVIETPERVPLHFALASTGNRFLACAFDHFLQVLVIGLLVSVGREVEEALGLFVQPEVLPAPLARGGLLLVAPEEGALARRG